jgi:signal transduction histidine kinase
LIHNSIKHGKASVIRIELSSFNENNLSIIYEDNGLGFDTSQYTDGLGLKNLQTRIEKYNGTVTIESAIGKGITVIAEIEDGRQTV